jgi:CRISPR-associated protein (TIGR03986 family)
LARAGWLKLVDTEKVGKESLYWELTPCEYARVEHNDLIEWGKKQNVEKPEKIKDKQSAVYKYDNWVNKDKKRQSLSLQFDIEDNKRWKHGPIHKPLSLEYAKAKSSLGQGQYEGQVVFTGQPADNTGEKGRKHLEFIFYTPEDEKSEKVESEKVDETVIRAFQEVHADSQEWDYWYKKIRKGESVPVFYLEKQGKVDSLGLAMMYRLAYNHSIGEVIKHTNPDHRSDTVHDLPELLFGTVNENEEHNDLTLKSRVSFSLAYLEKEAQVINDLPATILGGPNASYYPSYVRQKSVSRLTERQPYMTYMDNTAEVRGWKCYPINPRWHVPKPKPWSNSKGQKVEVSSKVKVKLYPLAEGARFKCNVKIHNLRPAELGALVWALTWDEQENLRHGLGMGKPFGLGQISINIKPESWQQLRSANPQGSVPSREACLQAFVDMMEKAWENAERSGPKKNVPIKWADSIQLKQLLAMADPELARGNMEQLTYMSLPQFQRQKNERYVLPPYVNHEGPDDHDLFKRFTESERWQLVEQQHRKAEAEKIAAEKAAELDKYSSDLERKLYLDLFLAPNNSLAEAKATEWLGELEKRDADEAQTIAGTLKQFYVKMGKWKGGNKKQKAKVRAVKDILGE